MKRKSEYASLKAHQGGHVAYAGHQERQPGDKRPVRQENFRTLRGPRDGGVCSPTPPACLLPSSSLSPGASPRSSALRCGEQGRICAPSAHVPTCSASEISEG